MATGNQIGSFDGTSLAWLKIEPSRYEGVIQSTTNQSRDNLKGRCTMSSNEPITAVGVFPDRVHAEHAVAELQANGFPPDAIGFLIPGGDETVEVPPRDPGHRVDEGAGVGALAGGTLGGLVGAALATSMIPGIGPVIAGGLLAGAFEAAVTGATGGAILGALIGLRIPEEEAQHYHREFHSGRTLVTVRVDGRYTDAMRILQRAAEWEGKRWVHPAKRLAAANEVEPGSGDGSGSVFVPRP
jgi:hypothetical protein